MLKSEEAFNAFLDTLPLWCRRTDASKGVLLKAFIAGGEFGAQFTVDGFKRKFEAASAQETLPAPCCDGEARLCPGWHAPGCVHYVSVYQP